MLAPFSTSVGFILILSCHSTARIDNIGENHGRSEENIILTNNPGINGNIILNLYMVAQFHPGRNHHILTQVAVFTNRCSLS